MKKNFMIIVLVLITAGVGIFIFQYFIYEPEHNTETVTTVQELTNTDKEKTNDNIQVSGKVWFEAICPPSGAQGCTNRVYLVDDSETDVNGDTPKIALTDNGNLVSCSVGSQECSGFIKDRLYSVYGRLDTAVNLGPNVKVVDIESFELMN